MSQIINYHEHDHDDEEIRLLRLILHEVHELVELLQPRPTSVQIKFLQENDSMAASTSIVVGGSATAVVTVLNQSGQPMKYDFVANPPAWSVDNTTAVGLAAGATPDLEVCTGLAPTDTAPANLSVSVPGVATPTDTAQITVTAAPDVPTSVQISFQ